MLFGASPRLAQFGKNHATFILGTPRIWLGLEKIGLENYDGGSAWACDHLLYV